MMLRQDHGSIKLRHQVVLDTLREHPWSSASQLSDIILAETGGAPTIATGGLWIPTWTMYRTLRRLEDLELVERRSTSPTWTVWWHAR